MKRFTAYVYSLTIDVITFLVLFGIVTGISFFLEQLPFMQFVSTYNLDYLQANPDILPENSVLISGVIFLVIGSIGGFLVCLSIFLKSRFILFNKLLFNKWKTISDRKALKIFFLQIFLCLVPLWFIVYVLGSLLSIIARFLQIEILIVFTQQLIMTFAIAVVIVILVKYSQYFYSNKAIFPNYPSFLQSLSFKKNKHIAVVVLVFFLVLFIIQNLLSNAYQLAFLESFYYYAMSFIFVTVVRVETLMQKE